jgi:hypothetical protein
MLLWRERPSLLGISVKRHVFQVREPHAVRFGVAKIVVDAMKIAAGRLFAHFVKKLLVRKPVGVIDPDPAPSVPLVGRIIRIVAAFEHLRPCPVGPRSRLPVLRQQITPETATRTNLAAFQISA